MPILLPCSCVTAFRTDGTAEALFLFQSTSLQQALVEHRSFTDDSCSTSPWVVFHTSEVLGKLRVPQCVSDACMFLEKTCFFEKVITLVALCCYREKGREVDSGAVTHPMC